MPTPIFIRQLFLILSSLMLGLLAWIPLAYGSTPFGIRDVNVLASLILGAVTWLTGWLYSRKSIPPASLAVALALPFVYGLFMTINAQSIFDPSFWERVPVQPLFPGFPGTIDRDVSVDAMFSFSACVLILLWALRFGRTASRRLILAGTLAGTGVLVASLGLLQRATDATDIFWGARHLSYGFFFGPYRYHGNAGAFLNLIWPLTALLFFSLWLRRRKSLFYIVGSQLAGVAWLIVTVAALAHGSRAATAIFIIFAILWTVFHMRFIRNQFQMGRQKWALVTTFVALFMVIASTSFIGKAGIRWMELLEHTHSVTMRALAYLCGLTALPDAGLWGFGPGTFKWIFPSYSEPIARQIPGFWRYQHQDYLQAWLEWGTAGFTLLTGLGILCMLRLVRLIRLPRNALEVQDRLLARGIFISLGMTATHALVDFPMQIFSLQAYVAVLAGLIWSIPIRKNSSRTKKGRDNIPA